MKNILVPTDFSNEAGFALDFAVQLASKTNGKVHVLNVVEIPINAAADPMGAPIIQDWGSDFTKSIKESNQEKLDGILGKYQNIDGIVEIGIMLDSTLEFIEGNDIDLVVMGTKGATGLKEIFVGSNAEKVVRYAHCPVITLAYAANVEAIEEIVFGLDLGGNKKKVIAQLKKLQKALDLTIHFVHINTPHVILNQDETITKMREFALENEFEDYTVNVRRNTMPDTGIIEFAKEMSADMIAMASNRRKGLAHFFKGSLAEDIVNHSPMPVWTISIKDE